MFVARERTPSNDISTRRTLEGSVRDEEEIQCALLGEGVEVEREPRPKRAEVRDNEKDGSGHDVSLDALCAEKRRMWYAILRRTTSYGERWAEGVEVAHEPHDEHRYAGHL